MDHTPVKKYLGAISILGVAGMLLSAYLTYLHFSAGSSSFCNINSVVNCDVVNKSKYAEILGMPVGILGFLGYALLTALAFGWMRNWLKKPTHRKIMIFSTAALGFSLYLTFIEFFVLRSVCLLCVTSQAVIIGIFILSIITWLRLSE